MEFYVAKRIPKLNPLIRAFGAGEFGDTFGMENYLFASDRFTTTEDYEEALTLYEDEPTVRLLFEVGAGSDELGAPVARFETSYDSWPPVDKEEIKWSFAGEGDLVLGEPTTSGIDSWHFDPNAEEELFFGPAGYQLLVPLWDIDWTYFAEGDLVSYRTAPFTESKVLAGSGIAELWIRSPVQDVMIQVTLTEVRASGIEVLIQSGWLRLGHRLSTEGSDLRLERSYSEEDFNPMPVNEWEQAKVQISSFAHPMRAGSSLRISVSSPGRDHGTWQFETPEYAEVPIFELAYGALNPSSLRLSVLPDIDIPLEVPSCPSLRGQPCREYRDLPNQAVD